MKVYLVIKNSYEEDNFKIRSDTSVLDVFRTRKKAEEFLKKAEDAGMRREKSDKKSEKRIRFMIVEAKVK